MEVVLTAVIRDGFALRYASDRMKGSLSVALAAVQRKGTALEYAADNLRSDRALVFLAAQNDSDALEHAAGDLQADREAILLEFRENAVALQHAAEVLKSDHNMVLTALGMGHHTAGCVQMLIRECVGDALKEELQAAKCTCQANGLDTGSAEALRSVSASARSWIAQLWERVWILHQTQFPARLVLEFAGTKEAFKDTRNVLACSLIIAGIAENNVTLDEALEQVES